MIVELNIPSIEEIKEETQIRHAIKVKDDIKKFFSKIPDGIKNATLNNCKSVIISGELDNLEVIPDHEDTIDTIKHLEDKGFNVVIGSYTTNDPYHLLNMIKWIRLEW